MKLLRTAAPGTTGLRRVLGSAAIVVVATAWFVLLRPVALGGPASYVIVAGVSMEPGLQTGDLVIAHTAASYEPGDVVVYRVPTGHPSAGTLVIHRIVGGDPKAGFVMQGDNRDRPDPWHPTAAEIVGESWVELPGSGRLFFALRSPVGLGLVLGVLAGAWFLTSFGSPSRSATSAGAGSTGSRR